jgi:hypothetical protein
MAREQSSSERNLKCNRILLDALEMNQQGDIVSGSSAVQKKPLKMQ